MYPLTSLFENFFVRIWPSLPCWKIMLCRHFICTHYLRLYFWNKKFPKDKGQKNMPSLWECFFFFFYTPTSLMNSSTWQTFSVHLLLETIFFLGKKKSWQKTTKTKRISPLWDFFFVKMGPLFPWIQMIWRHFLCTAGWRLYSWNKLINISEQKLRSCCGSVDKNTDSQLWGPWFKSAGSGSSALRQGS